jgi:hypothetical protein
MAHNVDEGEDMETLVAALADAGPVEAVHQVIRHKLAEMDRCIKLEHARYVGRMHWLGFNTQRITSVRGGLQ